MRVQIERGRKRELSIVVGNYISLFETRGCSIPTFADGGGERRKDGTLHNHAATTPPPGQSSPRPLLAEPHHNGSPL